MSLPHRSAGTSFLNSRNGLKCFPDSHPKLTPSPSHSKSVLIRILKVTVALTDKSGYLAGQMEVAIQSDKRKSHLFTKENAAEMAHRRAAKLRADREAQRLAVETATLDPSIEYSQRRLARVRLQLDRLDKMMMEVNDPQKLDRIASAVARLAEQERQLSGRPLPGTLRPTGKKRKDSEPASEAAPE